MNDAIYSVQEPEPMRIAIQQFGEINPYTLFLFYFLQNSNNIFYI